MRSRQCGLAAVLAVVGVTAASAQQAIDIEESLAFDRPESWAMKYFTAVSLPTGLGAPEAPETGAILLGFEGDVVPQLSDDERRVGFNGTKREDVNKSRFFGRIRGDFGLPSKYVIQVGYVPPIEVNGARPHLLFAGLGRTFSPSPAWRVDLRGYGQIGTIEGDITCSAEEAGAGRDSDRNPFLCEEPSSDRLEQRLAGGALSLGFGTRRWRPYVGASLNYADLAFEVNARYSGVVDHTVQNTNGAIVSLTAGLGYAPSDRWHLGGELFYAPLSVVRPPSTTSQNDGLLHGRFFLAVRVK